jgi:hypothetical protein
LANLTHSGNAGKLHALYSWNVMTTRLLREAAGSPASATAAFTIHSENKINAMAMVKDFGWIIFIFIHAYLNDVHVFFYLLYGQQLSFSHWSHTKYFYVCFIP